MRPVRQTTFGYPQGNCYAACIASIFELPIDDMPVISAEEDFNAIWEKWFYSRGLGRCVLIYDPNGWWKAKGYCILVGKSPRNFIKEDGTYADHAIVGYDGVPLHDLHPDDTFLPEISEIEIFYVLDPVKTCKGFR